MKRLSPFFLLACFGLLLNTPARADVAWRSPLTLGEPTEIPGTVLPPGKYIVKVLDTQETRKVVQFLSEDETNVFATVMAIPDYRVRPSEAGQFIYFQRAEGLPQALKSWLYPGNNYGVEFVYPKATAVKIAQARHQEVYAAESAKPEAHEPVVVISPELKERPVKESAPVAQAPKPAAQKPVMQEPKTKTVAAKKTRKTLPQTASHLPFVALAGLAAIGAAATLRIFAARRV